MVRLVLITVFLVWATFAAQAGSAVGNPPEVKVYPNPFATEIVVQVEDVSAPVQIEVKNLLGKTVYQKQVIGVSSYTIPVNPDWAKGIYIVNIKTDQYQVSKKLVRK